MKKNNRKRLRQARAYEASGAMKVVAVREKSLRQLDLVVRGFRGFRRILEAVAMARVKEVR